MQGNYRQQKTSPTFNGISDLGRVAEYIASDKDFCLIGDFTSSFKNTSRRCSTALCHLLQDKYHFHARYFLWLLLKLS